MQRKNGLTLAFAFGCALALAGMTNCSGGGGGKDAGPGGQDAGPPPVDSGTPDAGNTLGQTCINNGTGTVQQSNCQTGQDCYNISSQNSTLTMCSLTCDPNSSVNTCGANGTNPNVCIGGLNLCFLGCDTSVPGSCGRSDFACLPNSNTGTAGICLPDCNQQAASYCANTYLYPFIACDSTQGDPNYGGCSIPGNTMGTECSTTMHCSAGLACAPVPDQNVSACVTSCNTTGGSCTANDKCQSGFCEPDVDGGTTGTCEQCPLGYDCGSSGACSLDTVSSYSPCVSPQQCPNTDYCFADNTPVTIGETPGHCFTICGNGATSCNGGHQCVQLQAGLSICLQPCSADSDCAADAGGGEGTACTNGYCLPGTPSTPDGGVCTDGGPIPTLPDGGQSLCGALIASATSFNAAAALCASDGGVALADNVTTCTCDAIAASCSPSDLTVLSNLATCLNGVTCDQTDAGSFGTAFAACLQGASTLTSACQGALTQ
jgi:hypothetical protein